MSTPHYSTFDKSIVPAALPHKVAFDELCAKER